MTRPTSVSHRSFVVRSAVFLATLCLVFVASSSAMAQPKRPFTADRVSGALGIRYATDDLNLGLGLRGGYTFDMNLYLGGMFEYWFGESEDVTFFGQTTSVGFSAWNLLFEGGYDFGITPKFVIRPIGGIGLMQVSAEACIPDPIMGGLTCTDQTANDAVGSLGGQALVDLGGFNLGGELRLLFADEVTAAIFGFNVGAHF